MLKFADKKLDLALPQMMGILNVTPDSFSDGGSHHTGGALSLEKALVHAEQMVRDGASLIDVGGESTRPGAEPVSLEEELHRVVPVVELIKQELDVVVSVDTSRPQVMAAAAAVGAGMINDVRALTREGAVEMVAQLGLPVCIMHMQGEPSVMQSMANYDDVVADVLSYLMTRVDVLEAAGIQRQRIILDPGFGFGKTLAHNLALLKHLSVFVETGMPVLAGMSRKSMFGALLGRDVDDRMPASVGAALIAAQAGVSIVRVHDVRETMDVLKVWQAVS